MRQSQFEITDDNYFSLYEAVHCYASLNHTGLWSDLYSVLSQSQFEPGALWSETRCLEENEFVSLLDDNTCLSLFEKLEAYHYGTH